MGPSSISKIRNSFMEVVFGAFPAQKVIALPPEVVSVIPPGEHLRVFVMWDESNESLAGCGKSNFAA